MAEVMLWNNSKTASVRASEIREFKIFHVGQKRKPRVAGLYYDKPAAHEAQDFLDFGPFLNLKDAQHFLDVLHEQIERGNHASD